MPVTPTGGFQLQALPQPLSVPTTIGRIDVPELQQAFRGGMQNMQAAQLVGPQTRTALAVADYQTQAAMEGLKRLPEETKSLLATYGAQAQQQENLLAAEKARQPFITPTQTALSTGELTRATGVAESPTGFGELRVGNISLPYVPGAGGTVTMVGGSPLMGLGKVPTGEPEFVPTQYGTDGAGNPVVQGFLAQKNAFGQIVPLSRIPFTRRVDTGEIITNLEGINWTGAGAPTPATAGQGAKTPQAGATAAQAPEVGYAPWRPNEQLDRDDPNSRAFEAIITEATKPFYKEVVISPTKERSDFLAENSAALDVVTQQAMAIAHLREAYARMDKQGVKSGPINEYLPANAIALFGQIIGSPLDGKMDVQSASLMLVEKMGSDIKNLRAYAGIKELLVAAKPSVNDTPEVRESKLKYYESIVQRLADKAQAMNTALEYNLPVSFARRIGDKFYTMTPSSIKAESKEKDPDASAVKVDENAEARARAEIEKIAQGTGARAEQAKAWLRNNPK